MRWADSAARTVRLDGAALREEYAPVRRQRGPGSAIAAILDRLPRRPFGECAYTTRGGRHHRWPASSAPA